MSSAVPFSVLLLDAVPNLHVTGAGSGGAVYSRWRYESAEDAGMLEIATSDEEVIDGYRKIDNVTDAALGRFHAAYGKTLTTDDIFFYVYGLLHSPEYRERYAADLKKMLPRIPLVEDPWPAIRSTSSQSKRWLSSRGESRKRRSSYRTNQRSSTTRGSL
jgi:predicted helicase